MKGYLLPSPTRGKASGVGAMLLLCKIWFCFGFEGSLAGVWLWFGFGFEGSLASISLYEFHLT